MSLYDQLERVFHEPSRLAIVTALCTDDAGKSFSQLKDECGLTDGNLSRHLTALEKERVIKIKKSFIGNRPRTTVTLSDKGREGFTEYIQALESVLRDTAKKIGQIEPERKMPLHARAVRGAKI